MSDDSPTFSDSLTSRDSPVRKERFYIVETAPRSTRGRCVLPDGRVVLGVATSEEAREAAADVEGLAVVPRSELSMRERAAVHFSTASR